MAATAKSRTGGLIAGAAHGDSRLLGHARARLCRRFQRGQAGAARGVPAETLVNHGAVSDEDRGRDGGGRSSRFARRGCGQRHRNCRALVGGRPGKAGGPCSFRLRPAGKPTVARGEQFGDVGRGEVRLASVKVALDLLEGAAGP